MGNPAEGTGTDKTDPDDEREYIAGKLCLVFQLFVYSETVDTACTAW